MVFPKARLAVSACLFLAWIGFLAYLVARTRDPVILSRPQLVVSSLIVIADVKAQDGRPVPVITVKKIARALAPDDAKLAETQVTVDGLGDIGNAQGWSGPGEYIVPLTKRKSAEGYVYEVTPLPMSPGYFPEYVTIELVRVGPDKAKVSALVHSQLGVNTKSADVSPGILRRNVRRPEAAEFKRKAEAVDAGVRLSEGESRVYQATPDALAQLEELQKGRRNE